MRLRVIVLALLASALLSACASPTDPMEPDTGLAPTEDTAPTNADAPPTPTTTPPPSPTPPPTGPTNTPAPQGFAENDIPSDVLEELDFLVGGGGPLIPQEFCRDDAALPPSLRPALVWDEDSFAFERDNRPEGLLSGFYPACIVGAGLTPGDSFTLTLASPSGQSFSQTLTISTSAQPFDGALTEAEQSYRIEGISEGWFVPFQTDTVYLNLRPHVSFAPGTIWDVAVEVPLGSFSGTLGYGFGPVVQINPGEPDPFTAQQTPIVTPGTPVTIAGANYTPNAVVQTGVFLIESSRYRGPWLQHGGGRQHKHRCRGALLADLHPHSQPERQSLPRAGG